jgi:hypothetical protein
VPYTFEFDAKNRILRARFQGVVTDQMVTDFYARTFDYVARYNARAGITDFAEVTSFDVSSAAVHGLAEQEPAAKNLDFVRIIVAPNPHAFGMARMFQILGERTRPTLHVVQSREEALTLLGVKELQFEPLE